MVMIMAALNGSVFETAILTARPAHWQHQWLPHKWSKTEIKLK